MVGAIIYENIRNGLQLEHFTYRISIITIKKSYTFHNTNKIDDSVTMEIKQLHGFWNSNRD